MKYHYYQNPFKMGLLGGLSGFMSGLARNMDQDRAAQARLQAYQTRYGMMADVQRQAQMNRDYLKQLQLESQRRIWTKYDTGPDGKQYKVTMRSTFDPSHGGWADSEEGRVEVPQKQNAADIEKMRSDRATATQKALDARQAAKQKADAQKSATAEINKDYKDYLKSDPETQSRLLKAAGIEPADPTDRPDADKLNAQRYRKYLQQQNQQDSGTPKGKPQVKYDANGNAYTRGPDGKPIPYNPQSDADTTDQQDDTNAPQVADNALPQSDTPPDTSGTMPLDELDQQNQAAQQQQIAQADDGSQNGLLQQAAQDDQADDEAAESNGRYT